MPNILAQVVQSDPFEQQVSLKVKLQRLKGVLIYGPFGRTFKGIIQDFRRFQILVAQLG